MSAPEVDGAVAIETVIIDLPAEGARAPNATAADSTHAATDPAGADVVDIRDDADDKELPAHAIQNDDGSITLPLMRPVVLKFRRPGGDIREERLDELVLHRLTGADMRAIASSSKGGLSTVAIARSSRMNEAKMNAWFDRMDGADAVAAGLVVGHFLGNGSQTGR